MLYRTDKEKYKALMRERKELDIQWNKMMVAPIHLVSLTLMTRYDVIDYELINSYNAIKANEAKLDDANFPRKNYEALEFLS